VPHEPEGPEARLWALIEARGRPGADREAIDREIWATFGQDWAVMWTDLSGFSRQVAEFGICHFLQVILEQKRLLLPVVAEHGGVLVKTEADSFLILFADVRRALDCALALQRACETANQRRAAQDRVLLCVGLGAGQILRIGDTDCYGYEVNAASKLGEDLAQAGEILVTDAARQALESSGSGAGLRFEPGPAPFSGAAPSARLLHGS
jgi:adenylate cyclase